MEWSRPLALSMVVLVCLATLEAGAQPIEPDRLPPELRPWIPWVLDDLGDGACTPLASERVCVWPGRLAIEAGDAGASFRLDVVVERRTTVPLPGSAKLWPRGVSVDGEAAVVLDAGGTPAVTLPAGAHAIEGRFAWRKPPDVLPVPPSVARVALDVDGVGVAIPRRSEDGGVRLGGGDKGDADAGDGEPERLEIHVSRRIDDGIPLLVTTQLDLRVGGRARELRLANPLLGGALLELSPGKLAAHVEPDGTLVVGLRAGEHAIVLRERHAEPVERLALAERPEPWPKEEIWAWAPNVDLRHAEIAGGLPIDPAQTRLVSEWRSLAAFELRAPATFELKTIRRGRAEAPPSQINLSRQFWLDLDGGGFTVVDHLTGTMKRDWRLAFSGPGELGNVRGADDQLITMVGDVPGVEVRKSELGIYATSRVAGRLAELPAVGWQADVDSLSIDLHLPPGWLLLGASGVDEVVSIFDHWEAFDLLWILALALAIGKLCGWRWAPVAAVGLVLATVSGAMPWWAFALLAACVALLRRTREGRLRDALLLARWAAAGVLVYTMLVFGAAALHGLLYPRGSAFDEAEAELEELELAYEAADNKEGGTGTRARGEEGSMGAPRAPSMSRFGVPADQSPKRDDALRNAQEFGTIGLIRPEGAWPQDPLAVVQTGPGVPRWEHQRHHLGWRGPVARDHRIRLWLVPPGLHLAMVLLGLALTGWLAWLLIAASTANDAPRRPKPRAATAALLVAVAAVVSSSAPARAEAPSQSLLNELRERLTRPPPCSPDCVAVSDLTIRAGAELEIEAEVHVGATASYQLPGPARTWVPRSVEVDGKPSGAMLLHEGHLHLRLSPGRHRVKLAGPLVGGDLTLGLGTAPHRVTVSGDSWEVDGVDEDGQVEASIRLRRVAAGETSPDPAPEESAPEIAIPPWVSVTRTIEAGVSWRIKTTVRRESPTGTPIVIRFPILPGEDITRGDAKQQGDAATITLARDAAEISFESTLKTRDDLVLRAAEGQPWSETWVLECNEIWRCTSEGLAPTRHVEGTVWRPRFAPWPGEQVTLRFERPPPAPGRSLTVHRAGLVLDVDERSTRARLALALHTTTGGTHRLRIPTGVRLERLAVDGVEQPSGEDDGELKLDLVPGRHEVEAAWIQPGGVSALYRSPEVTVGDQLVNAEVEIRLPPRRWVLYAGGAGEGPDIRFWGYLLLLLVVAFALARLPESPLKSWQWALLAIGLASLPVSLAMVVAAWFFIVLHRKRWSLPRRVHNAGQIALVAWTLVAAVALAAVAYAGLTSYPNMMMAGDLRWYLDRSDGTLPRTWVLNLPLWIWHAAMAAWSVWLVVTLHRFSKTAWASFTTGSIWRRAPAPPPPPPPPATPTPDPS